MSSPSDNVRPPTASERRAERLAGILDLPVTIAGFVFLLVIVVDASTPPDSVAARVWTIVGWALWSLFVAEFLARLVVARSTVTFLRRNWWQAVFIALPFLRFLRAFSRTARLTRIGSSSIRTGRTAARTFGSRVALLASWTVTVVLAGATALFEIGSVRPMPDALQAAAYAAVAGEPVADVEGWARLVAVALVLWSGVGFATLAGAVGAFLLERHADDRAERDGARRSSAPAVRPQGFEP